LRREKKKKGQGAAGRRPAEKTWQFHARHSGKDEERKGLWPPRRPAKREAGPLWTEVRKRKRPIKEESPRKEWSSLQKKKKKTDGTRGLYPVRCPLRTSLRGRGEKERRSPHGACEETNKSKLSPAARPSCDELISLNGREITRPRGKKKSNKRGLGSPKREQPFVRASLLKTTRVGTSPGWGHVQERERGNERRL